MMAFLKRLLCRHEYHAVDMGTEEVLRCTRCDKLRLARELT